MKKAKRLTAALAALVLTVGALGYTSGVLKDSFAVSASAAALDQTDLADGKYTVEVEMIKTDRESKSMSNDAINHTVQIEVVEGEYYATVQFLGLAIYNQFGYLQTLRYFDEGYTYNDMGIPQGETVDAEVLEYYDTVDEYNDENNLYPKVLKFKLVDHGKEEYAPLQVFVPIMESISEGTGTQPVLMKIDWSTLVQTEGEMQLEEEQKQSPAVDFTAENGVSVHADEGVLPEGCGVNIVEQIGDDLKETLSGFDFKAYEVQFVSGGENVSPNGKFNVSLPVPEGYTEPSVYRISDGKKTLVSGKDEGGVYTVTAKESGIFAIVTESKTESKAESKTESKSENKTSNTTNTAKNDNTTATKAAESSAADSTDNTNPVSGSAFGFALMGVAGAAAVISKKKDSRK